MVTTLDIKIASLKKVHPRVDKEVKPQGVTALKSAMVVSRSPPIKESFVSKPSSQRYAELPSLRYGATPNVTATQMLGSGPLRVSVHIDNDHHQQQATSLPRRSAMMRYTRRYSSLEVTEIDNNGCRINTSNLREVAAPTQNVRRVRFAELPPKTNIGENVEGDDGVEVEQWMRGRIGIPTNDAGDTRHRVTTNIVEQQQQRSRYKPGAAVTSSATVNRNSSYISESFCKLPNYPITKSSSSSDGLQSISASKNKYNSFGKIHDTAKYKKGTLPPTSGSVTTPGTSSLPPLLRAAKLGDENDLGDILRRGLLVGIPADEVNAVDNSGRTAVSYIASNGNLSHLETILQLDGVDVNKADNEGNTPLHFAAQAGQMEAVNYMLSRCTDLEIDARNSLGFTPLMKAALQGRTKCAKLLLFAGASPTLRDSGRGFRAEQWARFCGRYVCAEVIEKFSRHRLLDRNTAYGRWGSEPELAARIMPSKAQSTTNTSSGTSIKSKIRRAFRTTSNPGPEPHTKPPFSIVTQLTSAALCASSPVLPSSQNVQQSIKSLIRPLSVPKLQVTLASSKEDELYESTTSTPSVEPVVKDRPPPARPNTTKKKKK